MRAATDECDVRIRECMQAVGQVRTSGGDRGCGVVRGLLESHPGDGGQEPALVAKVDVRSLVTDAHGFCHAPEAEAFGGFIHQHPEGGSKELLIEARADSGTAHRWWH